MRYAIIENEEIVNVAIADEALESNWVLDENEEAQIGGKYINGEFIDPPVIDILQVDTVSRRQGKQALLLAGLLDSVQPAIDGISDATERMMAQIYWDDAQEFERFNPVLIQLGTALGLTETDLDDLFVQAAQL